MPVNVPLDMLFGDLPKTKINVSSENPKNFHDFEAKDSLEKNILEVLRHPTVGSKQFLITIGDRTVGGLIARDQMVGKYQVPTSNYSMVNNSFTEYHGEAI
jgi:phosphoribosylformylglycinamidine synthase